MRNGGYYWDNGSLGYRRSSGNYWSSRASSAAYSRYLHFYYTNVYPQNGGNKGDGFAIRYVGSDYDGE